MKKAIFFILFAGFSLLNARAFTGSIELGREIASVPPREESTEFDNSLEFALSENRLLLSGYYTGNPLAGARLDYTVEGHTITLHFVHGTTDDSSENYFLNIGDVVVEGCQEDFYLIQIMGCMGTTILIEDYRVTNKNLVLEDNDSYPDCVYAFVRQRQPKTDIVTGQKDPKENDDVDVVCRISSLGGGLYQQSIQSIEGNVITLEGIYHSLEYSEEDIVSTSSLGKLAAGKYRVVLNVVDGDEAMPPFTASTTIHVGPARILDNSGEEIPYEFISPGGLKAGVDIWFKTTWPGLVIGYYQTLDSISDGKVYISAHYDFLVDDPLTDLAYLYAVPMGSFDAGNYVVVLSSVDDAGFMPTESHEIPFTVEENPVTVPCGLVRFSDRKEKDFADEEPRMNAPLDGDSLHITGWVPFNCCSDHYCYYEVHGDSVYIETVEGLNYNVCRCFNHFYVDFKVAPFENSDHCTIGVSSHYTEHTVFHMDLADAMGSVADYLAKDSPFEFIAPVWPGKGKTTTDRDATRRDYLFTGLNIEFMVHWDGLPYAGSSLHLDSIVGNKFYLNTPIYSAVDYDMYVNDDLVISLGMLDAGDYEIVLSAVDKADKLHFASYVVPFTVRESPLDVPRGMVYIPTPDKDDYKWREGEPTLSVKTEGDSLHITGWLTYTCCMRHYCYYEIHGDSIYLETVQAGYTWMCDCYDLHYVDFKVGPCEPDDNLTIGTWEYFEGAHIFQFDMTSVNTPETDEPADAERHYDLQGRPAESTRQGILIRNGKKVFVE